jgi:hypothetical protein
MFYDPAYRCRVGILSSRPGQVGMELRPRLDDFVKILQSTPTLQAGPPLGAQSFMGSLNKEAGAG